MTKRSPFRYFKTSPEVIRLAVMMYVRFPLSLRKVEDLLHDRGVGRRPSSFQMVSNSPQLFVPPHTTNDTPTGVCLKHLKIRTGD